MTCISNFITVLSRKTGNNVILEVKISFWGGDLDFLQIIFLLYLIKPKHIQIIKNHKSSKYHPKTPYP